MDTLQDAYKDSEEDGEDNQNPKINASQNEESALQAPNPLTTIPHPSPEQISPVPSSEPDSETKPQPEPEAMAVESAEHPTTVAEPAAVDSTDHRTKMAELENEQAVLSIDKAENLGSEDVSTDSVSEDEQNPEILENSDKKLGNDEEDTEEPSPKRQKCLSHVDPTSELQQVKTPASGSNNGTKKSSKKKSKGNNVWTKSTSRKGKKKAKNNNNAAPKAEDTVFITPIPRLPDKNDDTADVKICLSKVYKAERVELSDDRLSAGSCKGYRMVRATRGVTEGAWYFEIKVAHLGESGHTRLGWSTEKGDLQAPVGYDANSFGYRDIDGSKIHKALRQKYAEEGYKEGDVIGFYINLPNGNSYAPKPPHLVWYKGQKYVCAPDPKEDPPKIIPGSEISFFKNGTCQGIAFRDLFGGHYYPAASMYTLPNQPNCVVKFNFGPDFQCFPVDIGDRPVPRPMIEVPYHGFDHRVENGLE